MKDKIKINDHSLQMGYRYVEYFEKKGSIYFMIEPMVGEADLIYCPSEEIFNEQKPTWLKKKTLEQIKSIINSIKWNRDIRWVESNSGLHIGPYQCPKHSLEDTKGGREIEAMRLYHPENPMEKDQVAKIWHLAAKKYAAQARGKVKILASSIAENSVFNKIELPILKKLAESKIVELVFL